MSIRGCIVMIRNRTPGGPLFRAEYNFSPGSSLTRPGEIVFDLFRIQRIGARHTPRDLQQRPQREQTALESSVPGRSNRRAASNRASMAHYQTGDFMTRFRGWPCSMLPDSHPDKQNARKGSERGSRRVPVVPPSVSAQLPTQLPSPKRHRFTASSLRG